MSGVLCVYGEHRYEKVIEKSRFITTCKHVESEEEAREFISKIRSEFSDATHNCFAFVADKLGNLMRFSDDGEPQGTAGMPILDAIRGKKLFHTAVVVTRYFGGIKLGAGGLVRAYSSSTSECLDQAEKREYQLCSKYSIIVGYELADLIKKFLSQNDCTLDDTEYLDKVKFIVAVKSQKSQEFCQKLTDFAVGRVQFEKLDEYYFPFKAE